MERNCTTCYYSGRNWRLSPCKECKTTPDFVFDMFIPKEVPIMDVDELFKEIEIWN